MQFLEFMGNHPFLFLVLGLLIALFFLVDSKASGKKISPNEVSMRVNQDGAHIIDIRPKAAFDQGHITGSRNIPFDVLRTHIDELKALNKPLIIVCDMGFQSGAVVPLIGRDDVFRLSGGINNWRSQNLPLTSTKSKKMLDPVSVVEK